MDMYQARGLVAVEKQEASQLIRTGVLCKEDESKKVNVQQ
jgi:hypothetical protein